MMKRVTRYTPLENLPQFLTVDEFCTYVKIGKSSGYGLIKKGIIPAKPFGRLLRIARSDLSNYLANEGQDDE